jgi:hypothetical protein
MQPTVLAGFLALQLMLARMLEMLYYRQINGITIVFDYGTQATVISAAFPGIHARSERDPEFF